MPDEGRAKNRIRKTLSLPDDLVETIQAEADEFYNGDFTRAMLERLAPLFPEAARFLESNENDRHNPKKI